MTGMHLVRVTVPHEVATQVRAGQFFDVRAAAEQSYDPLWRRPLPAMGVDTLTNEATFLITRGEPGMDWLAARHEGDTLNHVSARSVRDSRSVATRSTCSLVAEGRRSCPTRASRASGDEWGGGNCLARRGANGGATICLCSTCPKR